MTRRRVYIAECTSCHRWYSMPTLDAQAAARKRGLCHDCAAKLTVLRRLIRCSMEDITRRARQLPEADRAVYRRLYRKRVAKLRQLETPPC